MYSTKEIETIKTLREKWKSDPIIRHHSFSDKRLWSKQEEILRSVRTHKRTAVKSGNTVGKSFISADVVMDWLTTKYPSKVITTASSWQQVEQILWKEIRLYCSNSKIPLGAEPLNTSLKFNEEWFAIGISTDTPVRMQGFHSPHLLVVIDEASGINPEIWEMIEALHPEAILAIGNPLESNGKFHECFSSSLWNKITISCLDAIEWQDKNGALPGLVTRDWVNEMKQMHGVNSTWYRTHVLGEFPEESESALIKREYVERARKGLDVDGVPLEDEQEDEKPRIISWDVASKHGKNENVLAYRFGHTLYSIRGYLQQTSTYMRDQVSSMYSNKDANVVVVDADGIGESMADILAESSIPSKEFHGGTAQKAIDSTKFKNLRTQFYYIVAKKFEAGLYNLKHLSEKEYEILRNQLCNICVKSADGMGRMQIESKEDLLSRGIASPDYADAFMMAEYGFWYHRNAEYRPTQYGSL